MLLFMYTALFIFGLVIGREWGMYEREKIVNQEIKDLRSEAEFWHEMACRRDEIIKALKKDLPPASDD